MSHSHPDCRKCSQDRISELLKEYDKAGYTWQWQPTGKTRERWWFGNKVRIQQEEVKLVQPPEMYPLPVSRWKTTRKEERK